jgi:hypothetical protein
MILCGDLVRFMARCLAQMSRDVRAVICGLPGKEFARKVIFAFPLLGKPRSRIKASMSDAKRGLQSTMEL